VLLLVFRLFFLDVDAPSGYRASFSLRDSPPRQVGILLVEVFGSFFFFLPLFHQGGVVMPAS